MLDPTVLVTVSDSQSQLTGSSEAVLQVYGELFQTMPCTWRISLLFKVFGLLELLRKQRPS